MRHRSGVSAILWHLFIRQFSGHGWRSWIMGFGWNSRSSHLGVGNESRRLDWSLLLCLVYNYCYVVSVGLVD